MKTNKLTEEEVKHIVKLAGLIINDSEISKFQKQLGATLDYIDILSKLNTENILPTDHVGNSINIWREDKIKPSLKQEEVLQNTKNSYQGFFKVKAVLEEK